MRANWLDERNRAVDRVMGAPGFEAQRSEAIAAITELGDFRVIVTGGRTIGLSALPRWIRNQPTRPRRGQVTVTVPTPARPQGSTR